MYSVKHVNKGGESFYELHFNNGLIGVFKHKVIAENAGFLFALTSSNPFEV